MLLARLVGLVLLVLLLFLLTLTGLLVVALTGLLAAVRLVLFFLVLLLSLLFLLLLAIHEKLKYLHYNRGGAQGMCCECHAFSRLLTSLTVGICWPWQSGCSRIRRYDSETQQREVQAVFAQAGSQDGETEEPGNLSNACGGRKARACCPVFQACALTNVRTA